MAILTGQPQKTVAGKHVKLKNRRVRLLKLEDGSYVILTKLLISRKERLIYRQDIAITSEAMDAVIALWMAMGEVQD